MRLPVEASSWLNRTSCDRVADTRRTGTVTNPKLIEPVQMACGTAVSPISTLAHMGLLPSQVVAPSSKKRPPAGAESATAVEVEGRRLRLTNLDKVLYPKSGFTKGQVIDFYARIGP